MRRLARRRSKRCAAGFDSIARYNAGARAK
jgi:hypothetical protein